MLRNQEASEQLQVISSNPRKEIPCAISNQTGAALILIVFTLTLVALAYMVRSLNYNELHTLDDKKTEQTLAEAKAALISWSVNHPEVPGLMPYPDRNADEWKYDGLSDCPGGVTLYSHLIGQLPWRGGDYNNCGTFLEGLGKEFKDGSNEHLWYAVSKNLVHIYSPSGDPVINPSIVDNPPYGSWLSVYDKNGALISNKVAVVIMSSGLPLDDQDRSGGAAGSNEYLDVYTLQAGGGVKSNRTYTVANEDFYFGENSRGVRSDNPDYQQPYYFNDRLVYITIDELMSEIEKRAAGEARLALERYYINSSPTPSARYYPYAAIPGSTSNPNQCIAGNLQGLLPVMAATPFTCTYSRSNAGLIVNNATTCSFAAVSSVSFTRMFGTYGSSAGACARQSGNTTCRCSGAGSCNAAGGAVQYSCASDGTCSTNSSDLVTGLGRFSFTSTNTFTSTGTNSLTLANNSSGSFDLAACTDNPIPLSPTIYGLPSWFTGNQWEDYIYYVVSANCTSDSSNCLTATPQLTVGTRTGVHALVISSGRPITTSPFAESKGVAQASPRPSSDHKDYLDSVENTNTLVVNGSGNVTFDAVNTPQSSKYNDQLFIIP